MDKDAVPDGGDAAGTMAFHAGLELAPVDMHDHTCPISLLRRFSIHSFRLSEKSIRTGVGIGATVVTVGVMVGISVGISVVGLVVGVAVGVTVGVGVGVGVGIVPGRTCPESLLHICELLSTTSRSAPVICLSSAMSAAFQ